MKTYRVWIGCIAVSVALTGCARSLVRTRVAQFSTHARREAGLSPADLKRVQQNCFMGAPKTDPTWDHGPTRLVVRDGYVLGHSSIDKIPLWVCEGVSASQLVGDAKRKNKFSPDPVLSRKERADLADYRRSGYDRGHQAPAGNQSKVQRLKDETFFLSNMAPQKPRFNRQVWRELEELAREWVRERGQAFKVTGGLFYDPTEEDENTADGIIEYLTIGKGQVGVPTHFYKIIVAKDSNGTQQAIAFVLENRQYQRPYQFEKHIQSIDWIEERTGLDFMPDLNPLEERRLEKDPSPMW